MRTNYQVYIEQILNTWQSKLREVAQEIIKKYGLPDEASSSQLIWYNNGPWKRTVVHRDARIQFPINHSECLEQIIDYRMSKGVFGVLDDYVGNVYIDKINEEVSVFGEKEELNILSLNLFHDIVIGKRTIDEARKDYTDISEEFLIRNDCSEYVKRLLFYPMHI